jgi:mannose-6-phosphate isomerase-like protein (cupin superfamily)
VKVVRLDEIAPIPVAGVNWRPVRRTLGIEAFGINAYSADTGEHVVEEHDETGPGAGQHEELYVVVTGHATITVDGTEVDAPAGTCVFLDDPKERRSARATVDGTTVLAIGGTRGEAFEVSPWEFRFAAAPAWAAERYDEVEALLREGLELHPGNASVLYDLACLEAKTGRLDDAFAHLAQAAKSRRFREYALEDPDFAAIRDDPRFSEALGSPRA